MNEPRTGGRTDRGTRRGPTGAPAGGLSCPGCGASALEVIQPDPDRPDQLLGVCTSPRCRLWCAFSLVRGDWTAGRRITAEERRNPRWTPARPAAPQTAGRA